MIGIFIIRFLVIYYAYALIFQDTLPYILKKDIFVNCEPETELLNLSTH